MRESGVDRSYDASTCSIVDEGVYSLAFSGHYEDEMENGESHLPYIMLVLFLVILVFSLAAITSYMSILQLGQYLKGSRVSDHR